MASTNYIVFSSAGAYAGRGVSADGTLPPGAIACDETQFEAAGPWTTASDGKITIGAPGVNLAQQATALLAAGLAVTSTATPALNGTYAADPATISYVNSEIAAISMSGTFADGSSTVEWPDVTGALHSFGVPDFKNFAAALGAFVSGVRKCMIGVSGAALPSATATIA